MANALSFFLPGISSSIVEDRSSFIKVALVLMDQVI
jgi:hypothetical protein